MIYFPARARWTILAKRLPQAYLITGSVLVQFGCHPEQAFFAQ
jgi:hypothetical protein